MALGTADLAKISVDKRSLPGAVNWFDKMQYDGGGGYHLKMADGKPDGQDKTTTAMAAFGRIGLGAKRADEGLKKVVERMMKDGPDSTDITFNYYATQVLFHWGGEPWQKWHDQVIAPLLDRQAVTGHEAGSWHFGGNDKATQNLGRLYHTAMAALILETYYRHPRAFDD